MDELCRSYNDEIKKGEAELLMLIAAFILDFLCIHPFNDGDGRMARLATLLPLYKSGYEVGRFLSLEKIIENIIGHFIKEDIRNMCSQIGESSINRVFEKLKTEGEIQPMEKRRRCRVS
jgi:fido (protein-threonine AMPylation protein)